MGPVGPPLGPYVGNLHVPRGMLERAWGCMLATIDIRARFQSKPSGQSSKLSFWLQLQSKPERCDVGSYSLQTLSLKSEFNQSLEQVTFPSGLKSLTISSHGKGVCHCQMNGIQILVFGFDLSQPGLRDVARQPSKPDFRSSVQLVHRTSSMAGPSSKLAFSHDFNQSLEHAIFPANLQSLIFGDRFNQKLEHVT